MIGPAFGYFANALKTWLVTKEEHFDRAKELFRGTSQCHMSREAVSWVTTGHG